MYNSIIVRLLVNIWNILVREYEYSILKKFNNMLKKELGKLSKDSYVIKFFTSNRSLVEESLLYGLYSIIIKGINKIFTLLRVGIKNKSNGSILYTSIYNLFYDDIQLQTTFYMFFIAFGASVIGNNLIRGFYSGKSYLVSFLLILVSLIGLSIKENYRNILEGSHAFKFVKSIFTIDEGVNQWW